MVLQQAENDSVEFMAMYAKITVAVELREHVKQTLSTCVDGQKCFKRDRTSAEVKRCSIVVLSVRTAGLHKHLSDA
jgi:hypothetical protein